MFFGLYLAANLIFLGFFLRKICEESFPGREPIYTVGIILIYYFIGDLVLRTMIQKYPVHAIRPYLLSPVKRSTLNHFSLLKSLGSFFNLIPFLIIVPFLINTVIPNYPGYFLSFCLIVIGWTLFNNYMGFLLDRFFKMESWIGISAIAVILLLLYLDYSGYLGLARFFEIAWTTLISKPLLFVAPLILAILVYFRVYHNLTKSSFLEDSVRVGGQASALRIGWFERFGRIGQLMQLETNLIWRNKRSRSILVIAAAMLLYPLIFLNNPVAEFPGFQIFLGIFITGIFAMSYGQLLLSWNSPHFDLLLTRHIEIEEIFHAKYYLLAITCCILFVLSLPYGFMDANYFYILPACFLFNFGISIFLYMLLASYNSKRIDPGKGAMMNYEGISAAHFLLLLPVWGIPYLIYLTGKILVGSQFGFLLIALTGLTGLIFHKKMIAYCVHLFKKNQYKISAAFRRKT